MRRYRVNDCNVQSTKRLPPLRFLMVPKGWKPLGQVPPSGLVTDVYGAAAWTFTDSRGCRPDGALAYFGQPWLQARWRTCLFWTAVAAGPMAHLLISDSRGCRPDVALAYFGPVKKRVAGR